MKSHTRSFTAADKAAHKCLRRIWDEKARSLGLTQEKAAGLMERTQGLVGQYLNGHIAIGPVAAIKFARMLECSPADIRPDFDYGRLVASELPPEVVEMAIKLASLPEAARRDIIGFVNVTMRNGRYIDWATEMSEKADAAAVT